jgi:hypothetical protein
MPENVLNDEQAQVVTATLQPLQVRDRNGSVLGVFLPIWTEHDIAEAKRRLSSKEPRYTTAQVLETLRALEQK